MWFVDGSGKLRQALVDSSGHIQVDVLSSPLSALIGEVQAVPTTYTVLDRLKTLATLLNAGLPAALDTGALKVREQSPITSLNLGNWPSDYPDAAIAKLLGAGLPSALTSDKLKVRASEIETLLGAGLPSALDTLSLKVKEQSPLTEIDVDIAKILGTAVSLTNYLPVGVVYPAGTLINPQSIRALTSADVVTAKQATASDLKVEIVQPASKEAFHVDTSGGTNIVIDKLVQGAYTTRDVNLSNDNGVTTPTAPPSSDTATTYRGKFFPRGCRGLITSLAIYCKRTGAGTLTLAIAPYIGAGATNSYTITPGAAWDWAAASPRIMWTCDSMFIWITACSADVSWGYENVAPWDMFSSGDGGATWGHEGNRLFIVVWVRGATVGDLPISGPVSLNDRSTYLYSHFTADAQIKPSPGRIHTVTINKCTTAGALTIYDNTAESGTVIATIALALNMVPVTLTYDVLAQTGIYVGFDASLVADITVSYL